MLTLFKTYSCIQVENVKCIPVGLLFNATTCCIVLRELRYLRKKTFRSIFVSCHEVIVFVLLWDHPLWAINSYLQKMEDSTSALPLKPEDYFALEFMASLTSLALGQFQAEKNRFVQSACLSYIRTFYCNCFFVLYVFTPVVRKKKFLRTSK